MTTEAPAAGIAAAAAAPLLRVEALTKDFGALRVLHGVSLDVAPGQKVAVIGPSGSGKSTLLRCVNRLEQPSGGHVWLDGELLGERRAGDGFARLRDAELAAQRAQMGMVFQGFYLWPHLTARDNVALAPRRVRGMPKERARELADRMLAKVHMTHKAGEYPERLSGGQQQRVAIARALAQEPKLLLFDEPTSALDPELVGEVLKVIEELAAEGRTMLLVTHEIAFARQLADRIVFMDEGRIVEEGPPAKVMGEPEQARTRAFLRQLLGER